MTATTHYAQADSGVLEESVINDDGSLWSHAATLGTRFKGSAFTIDKSTVENFIKVFSVGYPRKIPVDYEHGTVNGATDRGHPVPKAGDVLELQGVYVAKDFSGDLKTAAEKLAAKADRSLDDERNFGLWMRWRPTARALEMVKAAEYTELSIAFSEDVTHNVTGKGQGPGLLSVALTNLPFLDDMLPVAASRRDDPPPAKPATLTERSMTQQSNVRLLTTVAAVTGGAAPSDEDQAEQQLTNYLPEINRYRTFFKEVSVEIGEADTAKVIGRIQKLKGQVAEFEAHAEKEKVKRVDATIATVFKDNENKLLPLTNPVMKFYVDGLRNELMAGKELEKTDTMAAIKALKPHGITSQSSTGDDGRAAPSEQDRLLSRARELLNSDEEIKELTRKGLKTEAWSLACDKAESEFEDARVRG